MAIDFCHTALRGCNNHARNGLAELRTLLPPLERQLRLIHAGAGATKLHVDELLCLRSRRDMSSLLVSGSSGLIGSELVSFFAEAGWSVFGIDNNMRANFFGDAGDTRWNQRRLSDKYREFVHFERDLRDRESIRELVTEIRPNAIIQGAAQPSHDLAASRPFERA